MISLLYPKKKIKRTTLLQGMTDVHAHLLPGVDDGCATSEEALNILSYMAELGIKRVFLTPHVSDEQPENTPDALTEKFEQLRKQAPREIELFLAAEYMLDISFRRRFPTGLLTMPGRKVLVETSYLAAPLDLLNLLYDLSLEGYTPVIAHPERYTYMADIDYYLLKGKGYQFQLNLFSLCGFYGPKAAKKAEMLLKREFYDYVGSDCHDLESYVSGMERLSLKKMQINELKRLIENNNAL